MTTTASSFFRTVLTQRAATSCRQGTRCFATSATIRKNNVVPTVGATRDLLTPDVAALVEKYPSLVSVPVHWGEQDTFGHLNNVAYLRYFETGRIAYFEQILRPNLTRQAYNSFILARGIGPIVKSINVTYKAPVRYPDILTVATRIDPSSVKKGGFVQSAIIVSHSQERVVATADCVVVTFDYSEQAKADIPEEVIKAWKKGEGLD
ncbi:hypothetical protein HKX48_006139 [Thoreauomyces humboldtii]|nr:hypothetical protein HKX48_006139 [Thoreauomyces humboldtii]